MAIPENLRGLIKGLDIQGELVAVGESLVFEVQSNTGPKAWKVYPGFDLVTIERYQHLTRMVADCINGKPGIIKIFDGSLEFPFGWRVVPIEEVVVREHYPVAISEFIYGDTIAELLGKPKGASGLHPLQQIEACHEGYVHGALIDFSGGNLNPRLKTTTTWITTVNTKVVGSEIVVTDVCPAVQTVAPRF